MLPSAGALLKMFVTSCLLHVMVQLAAAQVPSNSSCSSIRVEDSRNIDRVVLFIVVQQHCWVVQPMLLFSFLLFVESVMIGGDSNSFASIAIAARSFLQ